MVVETYFFLLFEPISNIHKNQLNHIELGSYENDLCKITLGLDDKLQKI